MNALVVWLFLILLLVLTSSGRGETPPNPSVMVMAASPARSHGNAPIVLLIAMWLIVYMLMPRA